MIWGRFSRHNIRVASEKRGRGEEGKKKRERGRKRGKDEEKRWRGEEKKVCREGKRIFSKVVGKVFNNVMS